MKRSHVALFFFAMFLNSVALYAQGEIKSNKLGLGLGFDPAGLGQRSYFFVTQSGIVFQSLDNSAPVAFYVPINISANFRIEPSFGIIDLSTELRSSSNAPNTIPITESQSASLISLDVRCQYLWNLSSSLLMYVGPQLGLDFVSSTTVDESTTGFPQSKVTYTYEYSETDFKVGAAVGAEFFPTRQFSVGGEFDFIYKSFGNPEQKTSINPPPPPQTYTTTTERSQHSIRTGALFFLRWYFLQAAN